MESVDTFAIVPRVETNNTLHCDNNNKSHATLFEHVTKSIKLKFDIQARNMHDFIVQIRDQACLYGWKTII